MAIVAPLLTLSAPVLAHPGPSASAAPPATATTVPARRRKAPTPAATPATTSVRVADLGLPSAPAPSAEAAAPSAKREPDTVPLSPRPRELPGQALADPLAERARRAGLTAGAQVMSTVEAAAYSKTPRNGRGTIRIVIDDDGSVSAVSSTSPSWEPVAREIASSLQGRKLRVPARAHGLVVVTFAVHALTTRTPAAFARYADEPTDTRGAPVATAAINVETPEALRGASPSEAPQTVFVDPLAFLPLERHLVHVELVSEVPR